MFEQWKAIVNPVSGFGKARKQWPLIEQELKRQGVAFDAVMTTADARADVLLQAALQEGYRKIISVGGDGNFHDVVNGLMKQQEVSTTDVTIAVISLGTGNDWIKSSGVPKKVKDAVALIAKGNTMVQNAGKAVTTMNGQRTVTYFHSFAGVGFDAYVVARTDRFKAYGQMAYLLGMVRCLFSYQKPVLRITVDGKHMETSCYLALSGIGKYGGGGMKLMPGAQLDGGHLFVAVAKDFSRTEVFRNILKLYDGSYTDLEKVDTFLAKEVRIETVSGGPVYMESDGDLLGGGPFELSLIEKAIRVVV
ncbi:MAG: diacylglycerol kinase family protein [Chitinophagales bacterium]